MITVLTQKVLRSILAKTLSLDECFVVPMQGNWFNPQNFSGPSTWVGFLISSARSKTVPYFNQVNNPDKPPVSIVQKISTVTLQFIGELAEDMANTVCHWPHRYDVISLFSDANAAMFLDGGNVITSPLGQAGGNDVLAYNVEFNIQWGSEIQSEQKMLNFASVHGSAY